MVSLTDLQQHGRAHQHNERQYANGGGCQYACIKQAPGENWVDCRVVRWRAADDERQYDGGDGDSDASTRISARTGDGRLATAVEDGHEPGTSDTEDRQRSERADGRPDHAVCRTERAVTKQPCRQCHLTSGLPDWSIRQQLSSILRGFYLLTYLLIGADKQIRVNRSSTRSVTKQPASVYDLYLTSSGRAGHRDEAVSKEQRQRDHSSDNEDDDCHRQTVSNLDTYTDNYFLWNIIIIIIIIRHQGNNIPFPTLINSSPKGKCGLLQSHYGHRVKVSLQPFLLIFTPVALCWWAK